MIDQLLADYDEWAAECQEIAEHINAAQLSGEITPEQAEDVRRMIATEEAE